MARVTLTLTVPDAQAEALVRALRVAAAVDDPVTLTVGHRASQALVDAAEGEAGSGWVDAEVVDAIALGLGTEPEWDAQFLEWIADTIGQTRPHPGNADPVDYVAQLTRATGRDPEANTRLRRYLSEAYTQTHPGD